jgi:hypothetical protein
MRIIDWIKGIQDRQEEADFIDIESPRLTHPDPAFRQKIEEITRVKRELNWASWKIYQLESKTCLSEFEQFQLKSLSEKFKRLVRLHQSQEADLRRLQEQTVPHRKSHASS